MKKIHIYKTKCLLASLSLISMLSGCQPKETENIVEPTYEIETTIEQKEEPQQEVISKENNTFEVEYKQDIYDMETTFLSIILGDKIDVSLTRNEESEKSISLMELVTNYGYILDYDKDNNTITKENLKKVVDDIQTRYISIQENHKYSNLIDIESLTIYDAIDLKEGNLNCILFLDDFDYNKWYESLTDKRTKEKNKIEAQKNEIAKYNFSRVYKDFIIEKDGKYLTLIDYVLLNGSISYSRKLEEMFTKLPTTSSNEIEKYKNGVLKKYNIDLNNTKQRFNPNDIEEISKIIESTNTQDYSDLVTSFIALNNEYLDDETISKLTAKYLKGDIRKKSPEEIRNQSISSYHITSNQQELASTIGRYNALKLLTDYNREADSIELPKQIISSDNHKKACEELFIMQKVFESLNKTNNIDSIIKDELVKIFIDIDISELTNINLPNTILEPNERDYTWLYLILLDDYQSLDKDNIFNNFIIASNRIEKQKEK